MDAWSRFLETFFKPGIIRQYLPSIVSGTAFEIVAFVVLLNVLVATTR